MHAAGKIKGVPVEQVRAEVVNADDSVFNGLSGPKPSI